MKTKFQILSIAAVCLFMAAFISPQRALAQPNFSFQNWCQIGGKQVILANLPSTTLVQQSFPRCTVTVYLSGTHTQANIFSDKTGTALSNPFTADNDAYFVFYAAPGIPYDITISGGGMPAFTFPDVVVSSGGGGGVCTGTFRQVSYFSAQNVCSGDPLFSDNGNGLSGGLNYTGNGANFDAENSGSYNFTANDPTGLNGASSAQFNLSSVATGVAGINSATFGVHASTPNGGTGGGNINLFTSGSSLNGNSIFLTAISSPHQGGSGEIVLEGDTILVKADTTDMTLQSVGGIHLFSGSQPTTFQGGIAPETTFVTTTPYAIPGVGETTTLYNASGTNIVATLPTTPTTDGTIFIQKKIDSSAHTITITASGGAIDGASTFVLRFQYQWVALQYDAGIGNWNVFATGPAYTGALTPNDCVQVNATGNGYVDSGAGCGGGGGGGSAFNALTSGSNTTAAMVVGSGASLLPAGSGTIGATSIGGITITGTPSVGFVPTATSSSAATWQAASAAPSFSTLTSGTNTIAAMLVGTGSSLGVTGTGTIASTTTVALATTPTVCAANQYAAGVDVSGNALCIALPTQPASQYIAPQAISGCGVEYVSGLTYNVGACTYSINGVIYHSPLTPISLSTADPTNPRIDVIFVDTTQTVQVIPGVPAATPQQPAVDPSTQLELTFILVPAAATTPANTTLVDIYLEGVEWIGAKGGTNGTRVNLTSTSNPFSGTHDTEFGVGGTVAATTFAGYTVPSAGTVNLANYNTLTFYIRNKAAWVATNSITIQWFNGTALKGTGVVLSNGAFGYNATTNTTTYQQVSIPTSTFGIAGIPVTSVRFTVSGSGAALTGFYLDQVTLQGGSGGVVLPATLMNFKGAWSPTATYNPNDTVTSGGLGYVALAQNTNVAVTTSATWSPLGGGGAGGITSFAASPASWPSYLTPNVTNPTGPATSLTVTASAIPYTALVGIGANTVLGALTSSTPSALSMPSCSTSGTSALIWTAGVGFGCNAISGGGGGNTISTSLTNNFLPKANGVNSIIDSKLSDDGTNLTYTGSGTIGLFGLGEGTTATGVAGFDVFYALSSNHRWMMNSNNAGALIVTGIAAAGTANDCLKLAANGIDIVDTGATCGTGSGNVSAGGTLTSNALILGAGTTAITALGSLGTTTTVLHGNAAGAPTFSAVSLTADISGQLPNANLANASTTVNGQTCTLGSTCTISVGTGTVTSIATSFPITGGTITSTGTIGCATCVTSAASLASNAVVIGGGSQASSTISADTTTTHALFATGGAPAFRAIALTDLPTQTGTGSIVLATSPTLVTPILGAATATSMLASGNVDGTAPMTITTGSTATLGGTFKSGYTLNQNATAAAAVAYTLPTAAAGLQYCVGNSWNGSAATTGILTVNASASGQFIIGTSGTLSASGGNVTSGGAGADFACFVGVDSTHWYFKPSNGTWTLH